MKKINKKRLKRIRKEHRKTRAQRKRKARIERLCQSLGFFIMWYQGPTVDWNKGKFCLFKGESLFDSDLIMEATTVEIETYLRRYWRLKAFL